MGRRNAVEELEYGAANGLDTTTELAQMSPGFVREARNVDLGFNTGWSKRAGYQDQEVSWAGYTNFSILQGIHYTNSNGDNQELVFGINDISDARLGKKVGTTITNLQTGLSSTRRLQLVQFDDRIFAFNGDATNVPLTYDGATVRGFGIIAPVAAPVTAPNTGGNLIPTAQYGFVYKYIRRVNGILEAASSPSPLAQITLGGGDNAVDLTLVPSAEAWVTNIQIYRTVADGNQLFLEAEISNVAAYTAVAADSALTDTLESDDSRFQDFSSAIDYPVIAQQRLFVKTGPNQGRFSKIGQEGPLPESSEVASFYSTRGVNGTRDDIVGQAKVNDTVIILKERSIGRLDPVGTPPTGTSFDNVGYVYKEIDSSVGALSHNGGAEVFGEYVFLGRENVYATNGVTVRPVADQIQETIRAFFYKVANIPKVSAINNVNTKQVYFSAYKSVLSSVPDILIVGDYKQFPSFRWTTYEAGLDPNTHPGYKVGSFWGKENDNTGKMEYFFGNTEENGKIYQINKTKSDDASAIFFKMITRPYDMQRPMNYKLYKKGEILAQSNEEDTLLEFCTIYEMNDTELFCTNFSLPAVGGEWADDAATVGDNWDEEAYSLPIPSNILLHSNFEDSNLTADFATGSATPLLNGTPVVQTKNGSKRAFIQQTPGANFFAYDGPSNVDPDIGGLSYRIIFSSSGTPSAQDFLLIVPNDNNLASSNDFIRFSWLNSGAFQFDFNPGNGSGQSTQSFGSFSAVADVEYYFEMYWNTTTGQFWFFVDGVLQGGVSESFTFTAGANTLWSTTSGDSFVSFDPLVDSGDDYWIDEVNFYDTVNFTADHDVPLKIEYLPGQTIVDDSEILIWAGQPLGRLGYHFHRKAKFAQFVFKQADADTSVEMLGWGIEGSIFDQFSRK